MPYDMDLNLFRVFETIYRTGTLTQAAVHLHVTQPAVSSALARLRKHFNDPLFVREGQGMVPTALARSIAPDILASLQVIVGSVQRTKHFAPRESTDRFVLGMRDVLEFPLLVPLARALQKEGPRLQVHSVPIERRRVSRKLLSGEFDFVVDIPMAVNEDIGQQALFQAELCLALRPRHPLLKRPLTLERWLSAKHVTVSGRTSGPVVEDLMLQRHGLQREVAVRCQNYYAACHLVAHSDLVLVLPRYFGESIQDQLPLHFATLPFQAAPLEIMLYWSRTNESSPGHAWLRELILKLPAAI